MFPKSNFESGTQEEVMKMWFFIPILFLALFTACKEDNPVESYPQVDREDKLPADITKRTPATDPYPPIMHSSDFNAPIPMDYPFSTSGAEDSPFVLPDGNTLYFFFTPDVRVPVEDQLFDEVTGVWVSTRSGQTWSKPVRVWLQKPGKLALDGAVCVQNNEMWFASAREGYTGVNMFTAEWVDNAWKNWAYAGDWLMKEIQIGEVHLHGNDLYFHSPRSGTMGDFDIWVTTRINGNWTDPENIEEVNTSGMDGFPFVSTDGSELWITRTYLGSPALFRSHLQGGLWSEPELIVSQFAGEATLDDAGNLYFVHHYYENNTMIEADIYVAYKK